MSKKRHWTMKRGYAAGDASVSDLGPPPSGPAGGARPSEVVPRSALEASETRVREQRMELEKARLHIGILVSLLPVDQVPRYKERLAALSSPSGVGGQK